MSGRSVLRALACTAVLVLPLVALARAPWTPPGQDHGVLRLAWRINDSVREDCRPRTQQELDALPVHMRTPEECTGVRSTYRLILEVGDTSPDTVRIVPGGMRGDRPVFVLEERRLVPGPHALRVRFDREPAIADGTALQLDTVIDVVRRSVYLVTIDAAGSRLVVRSR
jgi:hypothetical protein